jgi:hypothetical protein
MADFEGFPFVIGWELTLACNLRCRHCGSSAGLPRTNELTLEEALALCNDLPALLVQEVDFTGGEPLMRSDWPVIAGRLSQLGIKTKVITCNDCGLTSLFDPDVLTRRNPADKSCIPELSWGGASACPSRVVPQPRETLMGSDGAPACQNEQKGYNGSSYKPQANSNGERAQCRRR